MAELVKTRTVDQREEFRREYGWVEGENHAAAYSIPVDADGRPLAEYANLAAQLEREVALGKLSSLGFKRYVSRWEDPARLRCDCGGIVVLQSTYNFCRCGRSYGAQGQEIFPGKGV